MKASYDVWMINVTLLRVRGWQRAGLCSYNTNQELK